MSLETLVDVCFDLIMGFAFSILVLRCFAVFRFESVGRGDVGRDTALAETAKTALASPTMQSAIHVTR